MTSLKAHQIKITDTTLRDAHQSLWATRMRVSDMLPIVEELDKIGFYSIEAWGGATFDASLRFLDEDPWERLRTLKTHIRNTPIQMLLRGQNLVGYRHYSDDIVHNFVRLAARAGIDIFRIFDALNDTRNLKVSIDAVKAAGAHAQGAVVYTISPVHTLDHYVETACEMVEMGVDSICIKDMAALLSPYRTFKLVEKLKKEVKVPIDLHCHYIGGMAPMNYLKGIEAGVDIIDTAAAPLAFGNSQPATEMIVAALKDTQFDSKLDLDRLHIIAEYFDKIRQERGFQRGVTSLVHMRVFSHQVPGGMISNLYSQLEQQKSLERMPEVLEEIPIVRAEVGYPPLVTPLSQIVGTQAVINVLTGKRWSVIPEEMRNYIKGLYGKPPGKMNEDVVKKVLGGHEPLTIRPADLLDETFEGYAKELGDLARNEEDVMSYALFPNETLAYLKKHTEGAEKAVFMMSEELRAVKEDAVVNVDQIKELIQLVQDSDVDSVEVEEGGVKVVVRKNAAPQVMASGTVAASSSSASEVRTTTESGLPTHEPEYPSHWKQVTAPMVGTFYRSPSPDADSFVEEGIHVEHGGVLCILEAMKLMNQIEMEESGTIRAIMAENGAPVEYGQILFLYEPDAS